MMARETRRWLVVCGVVLFAGVAIGRLTRKPEPIGEGAVPATASAPVTGGLASHRAQGHGQPTNVPLLERLSARHAGEDHDSAWADDAQALLKTSLRAKGTTVSEADCRRTLCKLDVVHDTPSSAQQFQQAMGDPSTRPWDGEVFLARTDADANVVGAQHVVMFISRKGSSMHMN